MYYIWVLCQQGNTKWRGGLTAKLSEIRHPSCLGDETVRFTFIAYSEVHSPFTSTDFYSLQAHATDIAHITKPPTEAAVSSAFITEVKEAVQPFQSILKLIYVLGEPFHAVQVTFVVVLFLTSQIQRHTPRAVTYIPLAIGNDSRDLTRHTQPSQGNIT